jgi:hypothetical protein
MKSGNLSPAVKSYVLAPVGRKRPSRTVSARLPLGRPPSPPGGRGQPAAVVRGPNRAALTVVLGSAAVFFVAGLRVWLGGPADQKIAEPA